MLTYSLVALIDAATELLVGRKSIEIRTSVTGTKLFTVVDKPK